MLISRPAAATDAPVRLGAGGGLTLSLGVAFGLTVMRFCRPPPSEERQRDLIGAWRNAPTEACPLAIRVGGPPRERGRGVIVIGIDPHKQSHTAVAVAAATGELRAECTVKAHRQGYERLLRWARALEGERLFALEDCRHVSLGLERFLIERGERVVRRYCWLERIERFLEAREPTAQVRIAGELVDRCRELTRRAQELERELGALVEAHARPLLALEGCGVLTAAKGRCSPAARAYLARREAGGKSRREALRCLKRHLARTVFRILQNTEEQKNTLATGPALAPALT
jgi:hypothetical protein